MTAATLRTLAAAMACALLASCSPKTATEDPTITVGMLPVADLVVLRVGDAKGYFASEGLKVRFVDVPRGDAAVSALVSNAVNFANVDIVTGLVAQESGLPIRWVTTAHSSPASKDVPFAGTFVPADSPVRTWKDLDGKKIGVSCRKCGTELYIRGSVDLNGGHSDTLNFVTMPTAQALPALSKGYLDAVPVSPTLVARARKLGFRAIGDHIAETALGHQLGPMAVNVDWADAHPDLVKAFVRGVERSTAYASTHQEEMRGQLPVFYPTMIPTPEAAKQTPLAVWSSCFDMPSFKGIVSFSEKYHFVTKPVPVESHFWQGAGFKIRQCEAKIP